MSALLVAVLSKSEGVSFDEVGDGIIFAIPQEIMMFANEIIMNEGVEISLAAKHLMVKPASMSGPRGRLTIDKILRRLSGELPFSKPANKVVKKRGTVTVALNKSVR